MAPDMKKPANSSKGVLQSHELYQYILDTSVYPRESEFLKELTQMTAKHSRASMGTAPDSGQLIAMLLAVAAAKKTIEIGVFTGYSLLLTALSIPEDGKIVAIDVSRESFDIGLPIIKKAGVEHKIDFFESAALPILDKMLEDPLEVGSFDFAYVDADKLNNLNYHERLMKLLRIGGVVVYDNTLWRGMVALPEEMTPEGLRETREFFIKFNKLIAGDPQIQISVAPLGDGITICRRLY